MKVILLKDIEKLGKKGDVKEVAKGYAKNFLLEKNLATLATDSEMTKLEEQKEIEAQQSEEELIRSQEIAEQIEGLEVEIPSKADEDGKLFGAVTSAVISDKLKEMGHEVTKEQIKLKNPIKETGEQEVNIELPHNLEANIKVIVTAAKEKK
ncbi:50S ribosomal protein L9 [Patescibacteria group bacterium]|nr:50S ribosomal protein L9 [Patescibacteria group bacterium]